jgi:hypothetical protein
MRRLASILTAAAVVLLSAAPVAARAFPFNVPYSGNNPEPLCGLDTVNVYAGTAIGRAKVDASGILVQFDLTNSGTDVYTLPATGLSVTHRYQLLFKNFNFVDNGDGTQSSDQTSVGKSTWYDHDGTLILTENGPITVHITIDFNVPPGENPIFTSVTLAFHGHHPDACPVLTEALGS